MNSISDAQPVQMKGGWRVVQALANTGGGREPYTQYLRWTVSGASAAARFAAQSDAQTPRRIRLGHARRGRALLEALLAASEEKG